jgi:uncharacterized membrane protein YhiD involved in acid resistance
MWREAITGTVLILIGNGLLYPLSKWIDKRPLKPGHDRDPDF